MNKIKVMTVFGTRPEAVKMAPLVRELESEDRIDSIVCVTAQHRQMLDQVLGKFNITPDFDLNIMQNKQTLEYITVRVIDGLSKICRENRPDIVLVHGDTTTSFAACLASFYNKTTTGHVEAGLRTFNKYYPYPEEMNRRLTGALSDLHFAPTPANRANLVKEHVNPEKIYITGNTVIDTFKYTIDENYAFNNNILKQLDFEKKRIITIEVHRRENFGQPLENICEAVRCIVDRYADLEAVCLVHLNPVVHNVVYKILSDHKRIHLTDPVDIQDMHNLMRKSSLIVTDSGGFQEEAPSLGTPVIVVRNETERQEAVAAGTVKLAGTDKDRIIEQVSMLIEDYEEYKKMARAVNPYGDGGASKRIVHALLYEFGMTAARPADFSL